MMKFCVIYFLDSVPPFFKIRLYNIIINAADQKATKSTKGAGHGDERVKNGLSPRRPGFVSHVQLIFSWLIYYF